MYNREAYKRNYKKYKEKILNWHKRYRRNHPNYMKQYWQNNKKRLKEKNAVYRTKNKFKIKLEKKEYYKKNKESILLKVKEWYSKNKYNVRTKKREYYLKNKDKMSLKNKQFLKNNPNWIKENYHKNKKKILDLRKIDKRIHPEKWKRWELNYKSRRRFLDSLKYQRYKELENQRRAKLGLPLVGEKYKTEHEMKLYLDRLFGNKEHKDNGRYKWLNGMELDRYYPKLSLAFEYHGEQHFRNVKFFKINLEKIQKRDKLKRELCRKNGIILIEIPYFEKISEQLILSKLYGLNLQTKQNLLLKRN